MPTNRFAVVIALLALLLAAPGCSAECAPAVRDGWVRAGPPSMPMLAGFGTIDNDCDTPLAITGAGSPAFGDVSLHETTQVDGISRMRALPGLVVPAGGSARLQPGGMHLMLADPRAPLAPGDTVVVEFALRDGGTLRGAFEVR